MEKIIKESKGIVSSIILLSNNKSIVEIYDLDSKNIFRQLMSTSDICYNEGEKVDLFYGFEELVRDGKIIQDFQIEICEENVRKLVNKIDM